MQTIITHLPTTLPGRVQPLDDRTCTVTLGADSPETIATTLIALDVSFALDAPPELLDKLHTIADRLATGTRRPR